VIACWALTLAVTSVGLTRLDVETDAVLWFPRGSHERDSYEYIRQSLSGISPMNVVIEGNGEPVTRPDVLAAIDALAAHLGQLPDVGKAVSVADPLAHLHAGFTGRPLGELPAEWALIEQYLVLLESVDQLGDVLTADRSSANIVLRVDNNGSEDLVRVAAQAEAWWQQHGPEDFTARATGIMFEFARSENEIAWGQIRGLSFALVVIGAVIFAIFRSVRLAAIAAVPNIVPLVIVFGCMGLLGIPLDAATVGIGTTAIGIAVDDTIHLLNGFSGATAAGRSPLEALDVSLDRVLPPVVYTAVAIAGGFAILALSNFTVTQNLGLVTAFVMGLCLVGDITLLPALLAGRTRRDEPAVGEAATNHRG
jgi:predicted RND superfamily exporter protein